MIQWLFYIATHTDSKDPIRIRTPNPDGYASLYWHRNFSANLAQTPVLVANSMGVFGNTRWVQKLFLLHETRDSISNQDPLWLLYPPLGQISRSR